MNHVDDTLNIDTPENVTFGYEIAGIGSRFLAALLDTALITLLQVMIAVLAYLFLIQGGGSLSNLDEVPSLSGWLAALVGLLAVFFYWGYYIFFEMLWNGKSPGKSAVKLRVIRVDGTPITINESLVRNLVRVVDFLPAFYGVGAIAVFVNPQTRRLGDLAAGTVVIREPDQRVQLRNLRSLEKQFIQPSVPQDSTVPAAVGPDSLAPLYPVKLLSYQDIQMVEMFFQRRDQLTNRSELAGQIILRLWEKMKLDGDAPVDRAAEVALAHILLDYRHIT